MKDQFLELVQLTEFFWNESKGLRYDDIRSVPRTMKKLKKTWEQIKALKIDEELALRCDMLDIDKSILL